MQTVKVTDDYRIFKKSSGRYCIQTKEKTWINGEEKVQILSKEGLIKLSPPKKAPEEPPAAEKEAAPSPTE